jgi:hypothetical protein
LRASRNKREQLNGPAGSLKKGAKEGKGKDKEV